VKPSLVPFLSSVRTPKQPEQHHNVYVVLLAPPAAKLKKVRAKNPNRDPK
jgi:hypothetical protein